MLEMESSVVKNLKTALDMGVSLLKHVEWCARISHRSEDVVTMDSWKRIIRVWCWIMVIGP